MLTKLAVARIAYRSSNTIISVQPALNTDSEFSKHIRAQQKLETSSFVSDEHPEVGPLIIFESPIAQAHIDSHIETKCRSICLCLPAAA